MAVTTDNPLIPIVQQYLSSNRDASRVPQMQPVTDLSDFLSGRSIIVDCGEEGIVAVRGINKIYHASNFACVGEGYKSTIIGGESIEERVDLKRPFTVYDSQVKKGCVYFVNLK